MDIEKALAYLTIDEKIRMLSGDGLWHTYATGYLPRVRMSDGPNGLRMTESAMTSAVPATCYPTLSMLANSFDPAFVYGVGAAIGREATSMGVNLLLAPGVNIIRSPYGGRNFEYFSEDPLLAGELGKAYVSGVQSTGVGACVKHFAANNCETNRMYSDSVVDDRALNEIYLKPFEIALQAQPQAVMSAYNMLNGAYCSQNEYLLRDVLRGRFDYRGAVISDWGGVHDRAQALKAGLDIAMPDSGGLFEYDVKRALDNGEITEDMIDDSLRRILKLTDEVYLEPYGDYESDAHDRFAYNAAAASLVMLKNDDNFLPLTKDMKVAVIGAYAECAPVQGGGSSCVTPLKTVSPLDAFSHRAIETTYFRGYDISNDKNNDALLREALDGSADCDGVIVFVGALTPYEGVDRKTLELPLAQNKLITELTKAGRKVAVVLCSVGGVAMPWINRVRAVIYAGLNGQSGAYAAVDALYGRINPCGKLAQTFPICDADAIPVDNIYKESLFVGYRYYDATGVAPLFPFGHGLSFSDIEYTSARVKRVGGAEFDVEITLANNSVRDGYEIVQIYVGNRTKRIMSPVKQLAAFKKVFVEGQTSATVVIRLTGSAFEFFDVSSGKPAICDGEYSIMIAASSTDIKKEITVKADGNYFGHESYPDVYDKPLYSKITDGDFRAIYGKDLPALRAKPHKGEYTLDCCIADIEETLIGKIMRRALYKRARAVGAIGTPEYESFISNALHTPLSAVSAMSDGALPLTKAIGIIEIANGKIWSGLKFLIKKQN